MTKKQQHAKVCQKLNIDPATIPMIMDVKDALKHLKRKPMIPQFNDVEKRLRNYFIADWSLIMIAEAMNLQPDGKIWIPDYNNEKEDKWEVDWFRVKANVMNPSGFGFSSSCYGCWTATTSCGSRVAFKEKDRLRFVVEQHERLFIQKILILKK